jgi:UDP-N-acetylglucosamine--N-acetylmuramyl-(pentapeptide) pyrophosphoryl-undecaprenol N-acetylglucosamine transferase
LICAAGSGGGVYPAFSVLQVMGDMLEDVLWVGGADSMEAELVKREGIPFITIPASGVHGMGVRALTGLARMFRGYRIATKIIREFKPDVLFFTGGYIAVPVAIAGRNIPMMLYVPDVEPGLALRLLARMADQIALNVEESKDHFPRGSRTVVTGHPTRRSLTSWEKVQALEKFRFSKNLPVLLVFGGSKGARSINQAIFLILPELLAEMQVLHISGELDWPEVKKVRKSLSTKLLDRYRVFAYLHEDMGAAYTAADLVVSRAGASSIGEFPLFALPAILVPYPYAWSYQTTNAEYLAKRGAAMIILNDELPSKLLPVVRQLLQSPYKRKQMSCAMKAIAYPSAAMSVAENIYRLGLSQH